MKMDLKEYFLKDEFARQNGIRLVEVREGYARAEVELEPRHMNAGGTAQGGLIFTLADLAFAAATNTHGTMTVSFSSSISFVHSASSGVLTAEAREMFDHRRMSLVEVRVTDDKGNLVALFTGNGYRKEGVALPVGK